MNNRRGDDLRSIGGFVVRGRTCLAKLSGVSSTTSGRPTAAPPIARAGRVASPAIASPEAAASPARRLTAPSPFATSAFAWARAVTAGRASRVAETRSLDLLPRATPRVATGANVDAATMLILDGRAVHARLYQWPAPTTKEKRHPSLGMWIILLERSQQPCSAVDNSIGDSELRSNYRPPPVTHTVHAPLAIRANFPSTAAEVSLENLLWDFPVPGILRDFGAGARGGGARDGHAVDSNDRNTRAIQVTAYHRANHRSHPAAPARHRPDHRALSHPPPTLRGKFFGAGVVSPSRLRTKRF